jgi:hypothetical protein
MKKIIENEGSMKIKLFFSFFIDYLTTKRVFLFFFFLSLFNLLFF